MERSHRILVFVIIGIVVAACIVGGVIWWPTQSRTSAPLRIGIIAWVGYAPLYIAQEKGFFAEEGIKVEIVKIEETGARHAALMNNGIQVAINTIDAFASGVAEGVSAVAFLKTDDSFGGDGIVARKEIKTVADLKGKTLAYPKGLPGHFFLLYLLDQKGLSSSDFEAMSMEAGDAAAAFIGKKLDAAVTWEPWLSKAGNTEHGHILTTSKEAPGLIVDILVANKPTIDGRADDLQKLMRAWFRALEYVEANPKESYQVMGKALGLSGEDFEAMIQGIKFADYDENLKFFGIKPKGPSHFARIFEAAGKIWFREGITKKAERATGRETTELLAVLYEKEK